MKLFVTSLPRPGAVRWLRASLSLPRMMTRFPSAFPLPGPVRWLVGLVIPLAVLGTVAYSSMRASSNVRNLATIDVQPAPFTAKISEMAELRALESATVSAGKIDVPIIDLVPEGTLVKKGDEVVRFDGSKYETTLNESRAALQVAEAELRKAREDREAQRQRMTAELARFEAEVRLARLDLENLKKKPLRQELEAARLELEKAKVTFENAEKKLAVLPELVKKGFITLSTLEEAELKQLEAKVALQAAQFRLDNVSAGAIPDELEKAQIRLQQAEFALATARAAMKSQLQALDAGADREKANVQKAKTGIEEDQHRLKRTTLQAPRDGLVVYAYAKAGGERTGEKIQLGMVPLLGQPLIYLPDVSTMVADTDINEIDIGKVKVGGPVEVRLEAYPGAVFHGEILKIGSLAKPKTTRTGTAAGIKVFDVTVKIAAQDPRLKPGLTATVDIIVDHQERAISVPISAMMSRKGEHFVFVARRGTVEERRVVLGPSNEQSVLVKEGLWPGERVLVAPPPPDGR